MRKQLPFTGLTEQDTWYACRSRLFKIISGPFMLRSRFVHAPFMNVQPLFMNVQPFSRGGPPCLAAFRISAFFRIFRFRPFGWSQSAVASPAQPRSGSSPLLFRLWTRIPHLNSRSDRPVWGNKLEAGLGTPSAMFAIRISNFAIRTYLRKCLI